MTQEEQLVWASEMVNVSSCCWLGLGFGVALERHCLLAYVYYLLFLLLNNDTSVWSITPLVAVSGFLGHTGS